MSYLPIADADTSNKGLVRLAGDLSGTASAPSVTGLSQKLDVSEKGAVDGVASLDSSGKVPSAQLAITFPVTSVAGQTGDVTLAKSDVGLANVDNTSDASKPISIATQAALDSKAATAHTHAISDVTNLQISLNAKADTVHTHAIADVTNLQTSLDAKAAVSHTHTAAQISDSTTVGRAVMTATDAAAAQSALAIANTVQVVNAFTDVTTPVYGTLYVVRA